MNGEPRLLTRLTAGVEGGERRRWPNQFQEGDEVALALTGAGADNPTCLMVVADDGTVYLGAFAAGEDPRLPSRVTRELGEVAAVSLFRQNVSRLQVPNGTYVRATTMDPTALLAESE